MPKSDFCYFVTDNKQNFDDSNEICKRLGGTLASIPEKSYHSLLKEHIKSHLNGTKDKIWIGLGTDFTALGKKIMEFKLHKDY